MVKDGLSSFQTRMAFKGKYWFTLTKQLGLKNLQQKAAVERSFDNSDGSVTGVAPVSGVAGQLATFSFTSSANAITLNHTQAFNFRLTVVSNNAVQINGTTNWATIKSSSTNDYVIIQAMIDGASDAILTNSGTYIVWTGGVASTNPLQRLVSKTASTNIIVTASLSGSPLASVSVWVVCAD